MQFRRVRRKRAYTSVDPRDGDQRTGCPASAVHDVDLRTREIELSTLVCACSVQGNLLRQISANGTYPIYCGRTYVLNTDQVLTARERFRDSEGERLQVYCANVSLQKSLTRIIESYSQMGTSVDRSVRQGASRRL